MTGRNARECLFVRWAAIFWLLQGGVLLAAERPNLLLILTDDQSYETVRAWGHTDIDTPHLDRLAQAGFTLTHSYNMGAWNGAVCIASRTMLNTGRFLWEAQGVSGALEEERQEGRFWSEYLRSHGYDTYMTGKWHVAADAQQAFDTTRHIRPGMPKQTPEGYDRPVEGQPDLWQPWDKSRGGFWEGGKHWSEVVADDAGQFLNQASESNRPFFMYVAFNAPHDPRQSPQSYVEQYPLQRIQIPAGYIPEYPFHEAIGCGPGLRDERLAPFPRTEYAVQVHRQEYYALISHTDAQIGRILEALEQNGLDENTYVFLTSDHGLAVGHHGLLGKQNMYDHSVRVPLIIRGPGVPAGVRNSTPVYMQDIMPTTLELAGIAPPDHVDFHSLMPLVRGETVEPYDAIYGAYLQLQRMVTCNDFKLIVYPRARRVRLYDLRNDAHELHDLSNEVQQQDRIRELFGRLQQLQLETGDTLDLTAAFPQM